MAEAMMKGCIAACVLGIVILAVIGLQGWEFERYDTIVMVLGMAAAFLCEVYLGNRKYSSLIYGLHILEGRYQSRLNEDYITELYPGSRTVYAGKDWLIWHVGSGYRFFHRSQILYIGPAGNQNPQNKKAVLEIQIREQSSPIRLIYEVHNGYDLAQELQKWLNPESDAGTSETARVCARCGTVQPANAVRCVKCGALLPMDQRTETLEQESSEPEVHTPGSAPGQRRKSEISPVLWIVLIIIAILIIIMIVFQGSTQSRSQPNLNGSGEYLSHIAERYL